MTWLIIISAIVVLVGGGYVAAWWWKLAAKIAPYKDELAKDQARQRAKANDDQNVIVISRSSISGPGETRKP